MRGRKRERPQTHGGALAAPRTQTMRGPTNASYALSTAPTIAELVWWPCGVSRDLTIDVTDVLRTIGTGRGITNNGKAPQVRFKFTRRRC